jgi:hypothetical protein
MSDDEFLRQLESCTLPEDHFHHADHLHAAWVYLKTLPAAEAIARCSKALRDYAASRGKPERYHETITWAHLLLLNERMQRTGSEAGWEEFSAANPDLFDRKDSVLSRYYRDETLRSDLARLVFVMPDRL